MVVVVAELGLGIPRDEQKKIDQYELIDLCIDGPDSKTG
jgi:hypothetical protein